MLLPRADRSGRVVAYETLIVTPAVRARLQSDPLETLADDLHALIAAGATDGMQTRAEAVARLAKAGQITEETARAAGSS